MSYEAWKARGGNEAAEFEKDDRRRERARKSPVIDDRIECDNCGDLTRAWDFARDYSRFCLECIAGLDDPEANRGDWEFHRDYDA